MTITIPGQTILMDTSSGIDPVWYDKLKALFSIANLFDSSSTSGSRVSAPLAAAVALTNTSVFIDGPHIALGTGTWFVSGSVTCGDPTIAASYLVVLWDDSSNVIASGASTTAGAGALTCITLSGFITSPAGNVKISVKGISGINGSIITNATGAAKDSIISAFRIA